MSDIALAGDPTISAAQLWAVLAKAHRAIALYVEHSIARYGIGFSDFMALEALLHKGPMGVSQIGNKILLASGSITAAVDRLEQKGLVQRELTKQDRRARIVRLTPDGQELVERIFAAHLRDLERIVAKLPEGQRPAVYEGLKAMGLAAAAALEVEKGGAF